MSPEASFAKQLCYAMRNGVVADALRQGGSPFRLILGVNLPQLADIAAQLSHTPDLALELWADTSCRESMLLAPMLMPLDALTPDIARRMAGQAICPEVADVLCHRLLRRAPWAADVAAQLADSPKDMERYAALRLYFNIVARHPAEALAAARAETARQCPLTAPIARALAQEAEFIISGI